MALMAISMDFFAPWIALIRSWSGFCPAWVKAVSTSGACVGAAAVLPGLLSCAFTTVSLAAGPAKRCPANVTNTTMVSSPVMKWEVSGTE
ncbi:hypothetical protein D3C76_1377940 [compost metagenome]